ncbi:hypothetical protein B7R78_0021980 [Ralstonia solanacearum]|nr:hypothetical protein [Ralstonia solanacearum]QOK85079.1 hypothetical protein HF906_18655 [Ralstonia solanacearum]RIJ84692.1 hypothetical protein RSP822_20085 [Ralstonia solanacearum]
MAAEISRYCASHPDAGDTLDGIAWWLVQQRFRDTRDEIEAAAEGLLRSGVLRRRVLVDGTVLFYCGPGHSDGDDSAADADH